MKTLIEALQIDQIGVRTPLYGKGPDGEMYPVYVHLDELIQLYEEYLLHPVPLEEDVYYDILLHSSPAWQEIWKAWRIVGLL